MARTDRVGEVTYNGFTFPGPFNCKIRGVPIYDSADRARKYIQYTISIDCIIVADDAPTAVAGDPTDDNLENIRKKLQSPYKPLTFDDQGFGAITVDGAIVVDARFGPKPRLLAWESVGSNRACRISWQCEVTIPECSSGTARYTGALAELTYQASWSINESGMTVRTIRGTIEVPISIIGGIAQDTVDAYRSAFNPPELKNFWRSRHYDESRGKNILEVSIIDTEVPSDNPLFPGSIKADIRHRVRSNFFGDGNAFITWHNTLSGTIEAAPGTARGTLWNYFGALYQDRRNAAGNAPINVKGMKEYAKKPFIILTDIEVEESIFSRELQFRISWQVTYLSLTNFLEKSGLFRPVPGGDWNLWKISIQDITGIRGVAKLSTNKNEDLIVDLCTTSSSSLSNRTELVPYEQSYNIFTNECPPKDQRYIRYSPVFTVLNSYSVAQHHRRADTSLSTIQTTSAYPDPSSSLDTYGGSDSPITSPSEEPKKQLLGPIKTTIRFSGYAERMCEYPDKPKVVSFAGKPVTILEEKFAFVNVKVSDKTPVYGLHWYITFDIDGIAIGDLGTLTQTSGTPEAFAPP